MKKDKFGIKICPKNCINGYYHCDHMLPCNPNCEAEFEPSTNALKGAVVVSGFHCPLYDEALKNWRCLDREHHADGAKKITETLWIKEANNAL